MQQVSLACTHREASRMLPRAQNSMTTRSKPTPTPPCGGAPYLQGAQDRLSRLLFCVEFRLSQWVTSVKQGA